MRQTSSCFYLFFTVLLSLSVAAADIQTAVTFSESYKNLTIEQAYKLQKAYVRNRAMHGAALVGFKAELNLLAKQEKYKLSAPITGVLLRPPLTGENIVLHYGYAQHLMIKQSLAFKVQGVISQPVSSVKALRKYFPQFTSAIELPDFNFVTDTFNGADIIANNALSHQFVINEHWFDTEHMDVDAIAHSLYCDDQPIVVREDSRIEGQGQWQVLLWMVNHLIEQGYRLQTGQILLTGTLDERFTTKICQYTADFGPLGLLKVTVSAQ